MGTELRRFLRARHDRDFVRKLAYRTLHPNADIHHPLRGGTFSSSGPSPSAVVRRAIKATAKAA